MTIQIKLYAADGRKLEHATVALETEHEDMARAMTYGLVALACDRGNKLQKAWTKEPRPIAEAEPPGSVEL